MSGRAFLFLDRDGVINRERGEHTWRPEDFEVLPDVPEAIAFARGLGYGVVVVTNQSGIGLGLYGHGDVLRLHQGLRQVLANQGLTIDDILYCPHHPSKGRCLCRKPGSLLLERAIARHGVDPSRSIMIGDRQRDMDAAQSAGIRGVLVEANAPLLDRLKHELRPA
jgi:D-glycero-D-manno-heptose 1,7-bisphosphate phosphatase